MPFYPLPALVALAGWLYVFAASKPEVVAYGVGSVVLGVAAFLIWDHLTGAGGPGERPTTRRIACVRRPRASNIRILTRLE